MALIHVGLDSWIIQDGNYGDFFSGESYRFALEFYPHEIVPFERSLDGPPFLHRTEGARYQAGGNVIRATPSNWVIDFGVPAFQDSKPPVWARAGMAVRGSIYVGIDPFFYSESLRY